MKDIYPEFADHVDFYAIGQSAFENLDKLEEYRLKEGYPWPVAEVEVDGLNKLKVLQQSTKVALDYQGVITYRAGYADGGPKKWREVFNDLVMRSGS